MKLDARTRELIAIGASVSANCQPCLDYHVRMALEGGADHQQIKEAIGMAITVRKTAASKMDQFSADLDSSDPSPQGRDCC